jgi:hypothetical protein
MNPIGEDDDVPKTDAVTPSNVSLMEVANLEKYLVKACSLLLDVEDRELPEFEKSLKNPETTVVLKKFINSTQSPVLLIQKTKG